MFLGCRKVVLETTRGVLYPGKTLAQSFLSKHWKADLFVFLYLKDKEEFGLTIFPSNN
jgi:hypothetical protein